MRHKTLTVIILSYNEELHIARAINSVKNVADYVYVIDSYSTDDTVGIAEQLGATVIQNRFVNHAAQFNWALQQLPGTTQWVLRLDADEIVSDQLAMNLRNFLKSDSTEYVGASFTRRIKFMGKLLRFGGVSGHTVTRLLYYGFGFAENRWMDEHIRINGKIVGIKGDLIDWNLQPLSWWINKHNGYASREVISTVLPVDRRVASGKFYVFSRGTAGRRLLKIWVYGSLPLGFRAFLYCLYRIIFRLGILDGSKGLAFHVLHGFWYRYLVDLKLREFEDCKKAENADDHTVIKKLFGIDIDGKN